MSLDLFTSRLDFEYAGAPEALFSGLSVHFPAGWTGVAGANGAGKTTLLQLLTGGLRPDSGTVSRPGPAILCAQETVVPPAGLTGFFAARDGVAARLREQFRLSPAMAERWDSLSPGERRKLQIAVALSARPAVLCLDEPTNHLDAEARGQLLAGLRSFRGVGVLVSHDRELLDLLCAQCLFLEPGRAVMRPGGFRAGREQARLELASRIDAIRELKKELKQDRRELQRRREKEQQARGRNSKRQLDRHDRDGKGRIDAARVSGRDRRPGDLAGRQAKVVAGTAAELAGLGKAKLPQLKLSMPYGAYSSRNLLLDLEAGRERFGDGRFLEFPALRIGRRDRIALTGNNGCGKSTLLRRIIGELKIPPAEYLYMPQELDDRATAGMHRTLQALPRGDFSRVMSVVAALGSRPERILDSAHCSPGEWRKLFFGLGALRRVGLIVMDEPTNHLDLPSIECLETALGAAETALLLVSHDRIFLRRRCSIHWHIDAGGEGRQLLRPAFFPSVE